MKKDIVYAVECEWDIGQEYLVFHTLAKAKEWCLQNENLKEAIEDEDPPTIEGAIEAGLLNFKEMEVI